MAHRTITPVLLSAGTTAVLFAEGALDTGVTTYSVDGNLVATDGTVIPFDGLWTSSGAMVSLPTIDGFSVTTLMAATFWGSIDSSGTATEDPDVADNAIVTLSQIKLYLNIPSDNTEHDSFLKFWINNVSDAVETFTNGKVKQQEFSGVILDGNGEFRFFLPSPYKPITQVGVGASAALSDIQYRGTPVDAWVTLPTDVDYILIDAIQKRSDYIEVYDVAFPDGTANIKLNMKCGYSSTPGLFKSIVIKEVAKAYKMSVRGGGTGEGSRTFSQTGASISSSSGPLFELEEGDKRAIIDGKYVWYDSPMVGLTR